MKFSTTTIKETVLSRQHKIYSWLLIIGAAIVLLFLCLAITAWLVQISYRDRFWPGVHIAGLQVGGQHYDIVSRKLQESIDTTSSHGFVYQSEEKSVKIYPTTLPTGDPDVAQQLVIWDTPGSLNQAWAIGKNTNLWQTIAELRYLMLGYSQPLHYSWDRQEFLSTLERSYQGILNNKKEAQLYFEGDTPLISSEATGINFNFDEALNQTANQLGNLDTQAIILAKQIEQPTLTKAALQPLLPQVQSALNFSGYGVKYQETEYVITPTILKHWLQFSLINKRPELTVDEQSMQSWLDGLRSDIERVPQNAKFKLTNGRVTEFQANQDGVKIDTAKLIADLRNNLQQKQSVTISTAVAKAENSIADVNDLGIKEILGTGTSNFSGSPKNRRHNIAVGAAALNGLIVKPGEEFSLLKALGTVDAAAGYLQELVIKGDRTIPEFGGGLCQIGTTTFRATLASGLPVTERRNHSYRVRYYEPAGTDATIYDPAPDYKFKNDTAHAILIQTRIDGDNIYFDFWGTKDGRAVEKTESEIFNIVKPGPGKVIETLTLPVGQKKCTEVAHNGADAKFDYTITYPNGSKEATTFRSHYVPWQEICLIGVDHLTAPQATSTPAGSDGGIINSLN